MEIRELLTHKKSNDSALKLKSVQLKRKRKELYLIKRSLQREVEDPESKTANRHNFSFHVSPLLT